MNKEYKGQLVKKVHLRLFNLFAKIRFNLICIVGDLGEKGDQVNEWLPDQRSIDRISYCRAHKVNKVSLDRLAIRERK